MAVQPENLERLGPRLRVVCNGDDEVNALRSQLSAAVEASDDVAQRYGAAKMLQQAVYRREDAGKPLQKPPSVPKDAPATSAVKVSCFVQLSSAEAQPRGGIPGATFRRGDLMTAKLTPAEIETVADRGPESGIAYVEMGEPLSLPHPVVTAARALAPTARALKLPRPKFTAKARGTKPAVEEPTENGAAAP